MSESSSEPASSIGAQATERLYTADEVRVLMRRAWYIGGLDHPSPDADIAHLLRRYEDERHGRR